MRSTNKPSLTIIIPNYNGQKWLGPALDSVAREGLSLKTIVVDNASTDRSGEICERYENVEFFQTGSNLGFARAANIGLKLAETELVLLLSADTILHKDVCANAIEEISNRKLDLMGFIEADYDTGIAYDDRRTYHGADVFGFPYTTGNQVKQFYIHGFALLIRSQSWQDIGGFDDQFFMYVEDMDLCWRLRLRGLSFGLSHTLKIRHFRYGSTEPDGALSVLRFYCRNVNTLRMLIKNLGSWTLAPVLCGYILIMILEMLVFTAAFQFRIARTYPHAVFDALIGLQETLKKRSQIQERRIIPDRDIFHSMSYLPQKPITLFRKLQKILVN